MKNLTKKTVIRGCSVALVAMMVAGVALIDNGSGQTVISAASSSASRIIDVTDKYNTNGIRSDYLNDNAVSLNASLKNEERWVIVELGGQPLIDAYSDVSYAATFADYANTTAAHNLQAQTERSNNAFLKRLSASGIQYESKYSYSTLLSGVAIKVKNSDIAAIREMNGVKDVYTSESYAAPTVAVSNNAHAYSTGIYDTTGIEQKGDGMAVAILDTGLDYTHAAFQNMPESPKYTKGMIEDALPNLQVYGRDKSLTASDLYINSKVPYAFDYADDDSDVYPAYSTHGTHVAGIVAGRDDNQKVKEGSDETFIGVAPEAQLVIAKVFTDNLDNRSIGGANAIDILAALADCITLGVDVINMSLGQSAGFSEEGFGSNVDQVLTQVYKKIEEDGISLVVAASNDFSSGFGGSYGTNLTSNPDSGTVGSPSTYAGALSVASINGQQSNYFYMNGDENKVAFMTQSSDANGKAYKFLDLLYEKLGADKTQSLTVKYVVVGGVGRSANYTTSVKRALSDGKTIAVIQRGDIPFAEKVQNAMLNGAAACIIYNNVSGNIRMTLGEVVDPVPTCSITMDAGKQLVESANGNTGYVTFSFAQAAGPFMSDFSSWGPTPDLKLKPEITAHGGEITSAVPGGYEVMSGTSMATPNMSGAIALLRQYAQTKWNLTGKALNDRVNQLLMSTATMARNEEGNPYSPRKQGAGLASILDAMKSEAYITAENNDGNKPKVEVGDDPNKTGVYNLTFTVHSLSQKDLTYTPDVSVMTESLSSDLKTVAEKAYMLTDHSTVEITAGGKAVTGSVTVPAGGTLEINVKITLDQTAKNYIDNTFANGMYVEGYVRFTTDDEESVELGVPYLAFYGDWLKAPLFDYSVYEVEASKADKSVEEKDKLKASASETKPLGLYNDEKYIITLGSYLYTMDERYTEILPSEDKAALSCFDNEEKRTVYQFYMLYAGLLRSAKEMKIEIKDAATGEVIYDKIEKDVRKSYAAGGSNIGSQITLAIDPLSWNLSNNRTYTATFKGVLDYDTTGRAVTTERDSYSFTFTIDTEAPVLDDYRVRFEPYTENNVTKYRIYLDVDVYDNQYAMTLLPCYDKNFGLSNDKTELTLLSEYPIPIYSQKGSMTTVSYEITDCYEDYFKTGNFYIAVQDYALNERIFQIEPGKYQDAIEFPDEITLAEDGKLTKDKEQDGYTEYNLTLSQYESYTVEAASGLASGTAITALTFECEGDVVNKDNQLFTAKSSGSGTVTIKNAEGFVLAVINVTVRGNKQSDPIIEKVRLDPILNGKNYLVALDGGAITLKPNTERQITPSVEPWYYTSAYGAVEFTYSSDNEKVLTIDQNGLIKTLAKGTAYITVGVKGSILTANVRVNVDEELDIENNVLLHYYGPAVYKIPDSKNILSIDEEAFKDNTTVEELELPISVTMLPENCFLGCVNLRKIIIPAECTVIKSKAFAGCESLEEIVLKEAKDKITNEPYAGTLTVGRSAFEGCVNLKTITCDETKTNQVRITSAFDNAFKDCTSLTAIDISGLRTGGNRIFEGCTALETVTMSKLTHIGSNMFRGCVSLSQIRYYNEEGEIVEGYCSDSIPDYAFYGCSSLQSFNYAGTALNYLGKYAFAGTALTAFTLPNGSYTVGEHAFADCAALQTVTLSSGSNVAFGSAVFKNSGLQQFAGSSETLTASDGVLTADEGKTLVLAPFAKNTYTLDSAIEKIGSGAFAGTQITSISLGNVTEIGAYAFAESTLQSIDLSGIAVIPEGAFKGCASLESVTFSGNNTEIGAYAFADCGKLAQDIVVDNVTKIGARAFSNAPVTWVKGNSIEAIGAYAFYGHNISTTSGKTLSLPALKNLGSYAFARNTSAAHGGGDYGIAMRSVVIGPVTEMGDHVFADCTSLRSVEFMNGATVVGSFAFTTANVTLESILMEGVSPESANKSLQTVKLPNTVKSIEDFAFLSASALSSDGLNTSGVETIGMGAFWMCGNIKKLNLSNVKTFGDYAFESSGLTEAKLTNAVQVGTYSFGSAPITKLEMPSIKIIGSFAFAGTKLTSLEIPASFNSLTYESLWERTDDFGEVTIRDGRYFYTLGTCAFAGIPTLETITVAEGNDAFFTDKDGVLYGVISGTKDNGKYVALLYPAGKTETEYTVLDNTVRIGDGAFYGVTALTEIRFPYTVKEIGSAAFFLCNQNAKFVFESVAAPVLEAMYDLPNDSQNIEFVYYVVLRYGMFYSNFYYYVAYNLFGGTDFGTLTLVCPENGTGYDNIVWTSFFKTTEHSDYAAEDYTLEVGEMISNLTSLEKVKTALASLSSDKAKLEYIKELSKNEIQAARTAYNKITSDGQRAFIAEEYEKLLELEAFVRETRAKLGDAVTPVELTIVANPDKRSYYAGEKFDATGLVLKVVYEDDSEVILGAGEYKIDKTGKLKLTDEEITFTYTENGTTLSRGISITVTKRPGGEGGLSTGAIVGICVGCVVVLAGAAVAVVLVLRKKKAGGKQEAVKAEEPAENAAAEESSESDENN